MIEKELKNKKLLSGLDERSRYRLHNSSSSLRTVGFSTLHLAGCWDFKGPLPQSLSMRSLCI